MFSKKIFNEDVEFRGTVTGVTIPVATQVEVDGGIEATKSVTSLTLETKLKKGSLTSTISSQAVDETDIVAKYNALQVRFEELVTKLNTLILK